MIVAATPNPAVDRTLSIGQLTVGSVHSGVTAHAVAGGKGFNVARAIRALGGETHAVSLIGGMTGRSIQDLATAEGITGSFVPIQAESRTCTIVTDGSGISTVLNEAGPPVTDAEWERFVDEIRIQSASATMTSISGSLPPDRPKGSLAQATAGAHRDPSAVWVDCSPAWLAEAVETGCSVKVNHHEAAHHLGLAPPHDKDRFDWGRSAASLIVDSGAAQAIVTLGSVGAVWATRHGILLAHAPAVDTVNSVGSGDCFLAGLLVAIESGLSQEACLTQATAAGAVNAKYNHAGTFTEEEVNAVAQTVPVS